MPNWVKNTVALKGTKQQMTKLFSQVADVKTWEDVLEILSNWCTEMEDKMEAITDRFYY